MFKISSQNSYTKIIVEGNLKHSDYVDNLIPTLDKLSKEGLINVMVIIDDFTGIELRAIADDFKTAVSHSFGKMAIITHKTWLKVSVDIFKVFISGDVKTFENEGDAEYWLLEK